MMEWLKRLVQRSHAGATGLCVPRGVATCLALAAGLLLMAPAALAYDGAAAADYARTWWNGVNTGPPHNYPYFGDNDCTNFVSQCLHGGGISMHVAGEEWYCIGPLTFGNAWTLAH